MNLLTFGNNKNLMKKRKRKYYCKHCKNIFVRMSDKKWIKSYCEDADKSVHLTLLKKKIVVYTRNK